ncbi:MAG: outer membrane protein OmpA-like peptidoglycan-associated protein [Vicingaceae bacterium]|jgi:outer membrane protein OmpA-like peptidoglycan-associated protein
MKKFFASLIILITIAGNDVFAQLILPKFNPINKQTTFSSEDEDSNPLPFNDGNSIYYNRLYIDGTGENTTVTSQDVWYATKAKDGWEKPYRLLKEDDLLGENLIVGTNKAGTRIYVFNALPEKDTLIRKLFYLDKAEEKYKWSDPVEVKIPGLEFGNGFLHFYVNTGETAILISKPPKGKDKDEDLFVSLKDTNGNWSSIIDLGSTINTNRFEVGSFLTNDLTTLYFSSEGHGGFGAADIFVSMRLDDSWQKWSKPMNLGEPINSTECDASFTMTNANEVYFTSDRASQHSNIFQGTTVGEVVLINTDTIRGVFINNGEAVSGVRFIITSSEGNVVGNVITDKDGGFKFKKLEGQEDYFVKLDGEDSDFLGSKIYFVNQKGVKAERYVLTEDGVFVNSNDLEFAETITGVFNYNSLPVFQSALVVLDVNGFPLDTIFTDSKGNFSYSLLSLEGGFSIIPLNMTDDDFVNVDMFLIDGSGQNLKSLKPNEFHLVEIKNDKVISRPSMAAVLQRAIDVEYNADNKNDTIRGVFINNGEAVSGVRFVITDSEGNVVGSVITDKDGGFKFKKLEGQEDYFVKLDEEDSDFVGSKIYFVNQKGAKAERYVLTEEGAFVNSNDLESAETITGVFNYNSLPAVQSGLVVLDVNGFPLDTIFTDSKGNFSYSLLSLEGGFSIIPLNMTDDDFLNVDMFLVDGSGQNLKSLKPNEVHLVDIGDDKTTPSPSMAAVLQRAIDVEDNSDNKNEIAAISSATGDLDIIYFDFGQISAPLEELDKLSLIVSAVKRIENKTIMLIAHTDNVGDESVNLGVAAARGASIRAALVERGVAVNKITLITKGETKPVAPNNTAEGRAKNRRVQVIIK